MAQKVFKGTEKKFAIDLTCPGFDQDIDDFEIEVKCGNVSIKYYSNPEHPGNHLFKETTVVPDDSSDFDSSDSDSSSSGTTIETWYCIVDTAELPVGKAKVIATAHVPDANAQGGIRDEIDVQNLFDVIEP